jgi:hypothetical protein
MGSTTMNRQSAVTTSRSAHRTVSNSSGVTGARPSQARKWGWLTLAAGGGVLGAFALFKRSRSKAAATKPQVGFVSDQWIAEHVADRES